MYLCQLTFVVLLLMISVICKKPRIFRGKETKIKRFPYTIGIFKSFQYTCAGSLIAPSWVLTAAHCLLQDLHLDEKKFQLMAGSTSIHRNVSDDNEKSQIRNVSKIMLRNFTILEADVSLLRSSKPFSLNRQVKLITLVSSTVLNNIEPWEFFKTKRCKSAGWSKLDEQMDYTNNLRFNHFPLISWKKCRIKLFKVPLSKNQICTWRRGKTTFCKGDSGSALVCGNYQIGVTSKSRSCSKLGGPEIWTRIDPFYDWIMGMVVQPYTMVERTYLSRSSVKELQIFFIIFQISILF